MEKKINTGYEYVRMLLVIYDVETGTIADKIGLHTNLVFMAPHI